MIEEAREAQLELFARDLGAQQVRKQVEDATRKGRVIETPGGVALMKQAMEPLIAAIDTALANAKAGKAAHHAVLTARLLGVLPSEVLAYLTVKVGLNAAITSAGLVAAASEIGAAVEEELRLATFEGAEPNLYATVMRRLKERGAGAGHARRVFVFAANRFKVTLPSMTRADKLHLGTKLIDLLIGATGFIEAANVRIGGGKKTRIVLRPTDKVADWVNDRNTIAGLMRPVFLPTVTRPREWSDLTGGGYHTDALRRLPLVKRCSAAHRSLLEGASLSTVYTATNAIQNTGGASTRACLS